MSTRPLPQRPPLPPAYPRRLGINPWLIRLPILAISGGILLAIVLAVFLTAYQLRHTDKIFPGVSAMGIPLGGLTQSEALLALAGSRSRYDTSAVFTFRDGNQLWQMTAADLGVVFDLEATVEEAFATGHRTNPATALYEQAEAWLNGYAIAPLIRYDEGVALAKLNAIAAEINRPTINAELTMAGKTVTTVEGQTGRTLDVWTTLLRLNEAVLQMQSGVEIPLVINETPPQVWNVDEAATKIRNALSSSITLTATDETGQALGPWTASTDQLAQLLVVERVNNGDGTQSYNVSLNTNAFEGYLASLAPGLIASPQDGRFEFNDATGQLEVIQPSISGRSLNVPETLKRMEEAIFTNNRTVPMAFDYTLPRLHNQISAAELGITQIVAESTTFFTGSTPERRTNIAVSASRLNGVIVAPGEEFSFNRHIGEIEPEGGFVQGKVIFGGRTIEGVGGGVCQTSTTVFRAAFTGGFAITERNSHGYRVGFYELNGFPPGLDAAIWQPERDFRFQNNTPHYLLIETSFMPDTNALQVRFYSTKYFNAEIENAVIKNITPPLATRYEANQDLRQGELLQVDYSAEGAEVTVYRNVYDMQGNLVSEDYIYTNYLPWGAIYQVAPTDSRLANQS